jgi:hypothetical protein
MGAREKGRAGNWGVVGGGGEVLAEEAALLRELGARPMVEGFGLVGKTGVEIMVKLEIFGETGAGAGAMVDGDVHA